MRRKVPVRADVAEHTRTIHQALHDDPVLRRLTEPDILEPEYFRALRVLQNFYRAVEDERQRLRSWDMFSLVGECAALAKDLPASDAAGIALTFSNEVELLGGLYVAHGASFGRGVFRRNLSQALPHLPRHFVSQSTEPAVWRQLTDCMDDAGQTPHGLRDVQRGAMCGFELVASASAAIRL